MPESSPTEVDHPVLGHFRQKSKTTGKSVHYDPAGTGGWPTAKDVWTGDPNSDEAKELLAGLDHNGPLIGKPKAEEPKPAASRSTTAKSADSKES